MSTSEDTAPRLADYGSMLRRRWWIIAVGLLAGTFVGVVAMVVVPPTYEGSANVLVLPTDVPGQPGNAANGRTNDAVNLDTEAQLVTSAAVVGDAAAEMNSEESLTDLVERIRVSVPPNSTVLTITYAGETPAKAANWANSLARSYLDNRESTAEEHAAQHAKSLAKRQKRLEKKLDKVTGEIADLPPGSTEKRLAETERNLLTDQISDVNDELTPLRELSVNPGRIIARATPPTAASQPVPILFAVSGAALGLLGGLAVAVLADRRDHRIRRAADVTRLLDLPVIADLDLPRREATWFSLLPSKSSPAQELRQLQHLVAGAVGTKPRVVLVTAASVGPAAQFVAANLTATLARSGKRVAHVCADLGNAAGAAMLGVRYGPGLAEVLLAEGTVADTIQQSPGNDRIQVLAPGVRTGGVGDGLPTDNLEAVVTVLAGGHDYVVLETPPTTVTADAQAWAQFSTVGIVAVQRMHTVREDALDAVHQLERVGCDVLGLAVLPRHPKRAPAGRASGFAVEPATSTAHPVGHAHDTHATDDEPMHDSRSTLRLHARDAAAGGRSHTAAHDTPWGR